MKKARKLMSLVLAGCMLCSMTAMAKEVGAHVIDYELPENDLPSEIVNGALAEGKQVDEYMNNAVTSIWAMDKVVPVAQGGKVIIDGKETNLTFCVLKPELSRIYSAKEHAAALGGCVLNVVKVKAPANLMWANANVNFYTPGIVAGQNVKVYAYVNDTWAECKVTEVREDHVVLDMTSDGILAFIEVAAAR